MNGPPCSVTHMNNLLRSRIRETRVLFDSDKTIFAVLIAYCLIFAGFFFMDTGLHRGVFYISLPFSLHLIWRERALLRQGAARHKWIFIPVACYLFYMCLSLFWSEVTEEGREFDKAKILFFLPISMAAIYLLLQKFPAAYGYLVSCLAAGAFFAGIYAVGAYLGEGRFDNRLEALGRAENSVMGAYLYVLALLALFCSKDMAKLPWTYRIPAALVLALVILLTQSRGPMLAMGAGIGAVLIARRHYRLLGAGAVAAILLGALVFATPLHTKIPALNRADTGRLAVWEQSIDNIEDSPVFGHGIGAKFFYKYKSRHDRIETASHPHSLYLGTLVQGGAIGLALLITILISGLLTAGRLARRTGESWPLAAISACCFLGLYDFGGAYMNMNAVWLSLWFQIALITSMAKPQNPV